MTLPKSLLKLLLLGGILVGSMAAVVCADEPTTIKLTLHPQAIEDHGPLRPLLPEAPDLKPGNAAVVLLRMPWVKILRKTFAVQTRLQMPIQWLED
jgi:hypothetical protein